MKTKAEQRKYRRTDCVVPVDGKQGTAFDGVKTVDISSGGMGFVSSKSIPLNEKIVVQLELQPEDEPVLVVGLVKWVSKIKNTGYYRVGMIFVNENKNGFSSRLKKYFPK